MKKFIPILRRSLVHFPKYSCQTLKAETISSATKTTNYEYQQTLNPLNNSEINRSIGQDYRKLRIGFIGTGTISSSMIKGLCNPKIEDKRAQRVVVSDIEKQKCESLAAEFDQITIAKDNQDLIDNSDWIVIGLLTTHVKSVLKDLRFRDDQTIINLAAMPCDKFAEAINETQPKQIIRACPLPPIALNVGATIVSPPNQEVQEMFDALGQSVAVNTSHETYSLQGLACLQGAQFALMETTYSWMVEKQKIDPEVAKTYVMGTFHSILVDAMDKISNKNRTFQDLIDEQTPGGLNEQNLNFLKEQGFTDLFKTALDNTYEKMIKKK